MDRPRQSANPDARKESDEISFLSPAETQGILSALEERDARMLGSSGTTGLQADDDDEGFFVSPEDLEQGGVEITIPSRKQQPGTESRNSHPGPAIQSDILTRIAGELRSIKSELGSLKTNYDDMIARSDPDAAEAWENDTDARRELPEDIYDDMKRLLVYLDRLLESLPESKIDEFAGSEYFELYRKVFDYFELS